MSTTSFNWSTPLALSSSSFNSSDAFTAIDANNNSVAVWVENAFIKSSSRPNNSSWFSPVTVSNSGSSSPRLVIDNNGNATVLWVENGIIKTSSKTILGLWTPALSLSSSGASSPTIAVDIAGNLVAAWIRSGNVEATTKLFGIAWSNKVIISSTSASSPHIAVAGTGSNIRAVLVWHSTSTNLVYSSTKLLPTGNWSAQQIISDANRTSAYAKVAVDNNTNAMAIWYTYNLSNNVYSGVIVQAASRSGSTGKWSAVDDLSETTGIYNPAYLSRSIKLDSNGNAIALWTTSLDGSNFSIQYAIKPFGNNWSVAKELTNTRYSFAADLAVVPLGLAVAAFMYYNGDSLIILEAELTLSGYKLQEWAVPVNVSSGNVNSCPHIAVSVLDNNVNAVVAWVNFNGTHNIINVSNGSKPLVLSPSGLTVTQVTNNIGPFTDYTNNLQWTASNDPNLAAYAIFRNGVFINKIASNATTYSDHNQPQNGTAIYGVAALDNQEAQSNIITDTFP